jgi:hypothetical protein
VHLKNIFQTLTWKGTDVGLIFYENVKSQNQLTLNYSILNIIVGDMNVLRDGLHKRRFATY